MLVVRNIFCALFMLLVISDLSSANVRLCGKSLAQILDIVCGEGFNRKNLKAKKSIPLIDFNESAPEYDIQPSMFSSLFKDEHNFDPNNLMAKPRRRRYDGVANECCRKHCAMSELLSYCQ